MKPKITLHPHASRSLLCIQFCCCSHFVRRRSSLKKGTPCDLFLPRPGQICRKTTTLVRDLEYFILTKFHQNPSRGSGEEVENVNCLTDDGRTTDRRTDDGQRMITIGHWSIRLLCPKNGDGSEGLLR